MSGEKQMQLSREEQFRLAFQSFYPMVVRHLLYLLGNNQAAEDVAQEVFLRLHHVGIDNVDYPKSWLLKAATNRAFNYLNSEKARQQREQRQFLEAGNEVVSLEHKFLLKEEVRRVYQALQCLSERDRTALLLKMSGHSYREIALTVKVPQTSVGTIIARAKKKLIQELERK